MPSKSSARLAALTVAAVCAASTITLTSPAHAESVRIHDIQGDTRTSPYAGQQVTDVAGIVTGVRTYGSPADSGSRIRRRTPTRHHEGVFDHDGLAPQGVAVGTPSRPGRCRSAPAAVLRHRATRSPGSADSAARSVPRRRSYAPSRPSPPARPPSRRRSSPATASASRPAGPAWRCSASSARSSPRPCRAGPPRGPSHGPLTSIFPATLLDRVAEFVPVRSISRRSSSGPLAPRAAPCSTAGSMWDPEPDPEAPAFAGAFTPFTSRVIGAPFP
ncbi:hypothetical protein SHIRM173S_06974 [Streptomyces hirsutus]